MSVVTGIVAREPVVLEKVIYINILLQESDSPIQAVFFRKFRSQEDDAYLLKVEVGQEIGLEGKYQLNPKTTKTQFSIGRVLRDEDYNPSQVTTEPSQTKTVYSSDKTIPPLPNVF